MTATRHLAIAHAWSGFANFIMSRAKETERHSNKRETGLAEV